MSTIIRPPYFAASDRIKREDRTKELARALATAAEANASVAHVLREHGSKDLGDAFADVTLNALKMVITATIGPKDEGETE